VVNLKEWLIVRPMKWRRVITCFTGTARLLDNPGDYFWVSHETEGGSFGLLPQLNCAAGAEEGRLVHQSSLKRR
jgi:hypothetical protein